MLRLPLPSHREHFANQFCPTTPPMSTTMVDSRFANLSQSLKFVKLVDKYQQKYRPTLSVSAILALQDCRFLAGLSMDFLLSSYDSVNATSRTLSPAWSIKNGLSVPLSNDTKLYSVSLALFTKGWVPKKKKKAGWAWQRSSKRQLGFKHGRLHFKMSSKTNTIYETVSRRNLLQTNNGGVEEEVLVSDIVTVSLDGSGNFTTITNALTAAPNNTNGLNGYFLIYITAGVYQDCGGSKFCCGEHNIPEHSRSNQAPSRRSSKQPMDGQFNAITAQGRTDPNQNTGTSIHDCNIMAADGLAPSNTIFRTYLGRLWKEYSRTVYMQNIMGSLVDPAGWRAWDGDFALNTSYYAEYKNSGPGSNISQSSM
ncbi:Pectinesterase [Hibiscus syriacus]|uniref:Pectinesterase n=1 Tax=Hibiscus syriacus TaxID=106335 RepID=A0A6A2YBN4_HIBSY|nr:Pectinesterase [Hibiscus syriacus]